MLNDLLNKLCEDIKFIYEHETVDYNTLCTLEQEEVVCSVECLGASGFLVGKNWYSVELVNGETFDVYCED